MWHLKWGISRFRRYIKTVLRLYSTCCRIGLGKSYTGVTIRATSSVQSHIKVWIVEVNSVWSTSQKSRKRLLLNGGIHRNSPLIVVPVYRNSRVQGLQSLRRNGTQLTTVGGASWLVHCLSREKCPKLLKYSETHFLFLDQFRSAVKSFYCVIYFTAINLSHACLRTVMLETVRPKKYYTTKVLQVYF